MWEVHYEWELAPWEPEDNVFLAWAFGELMDIVQLQSIETSRLGTEHLPQALRPKEDIVLDWRTHLPLLDRKRDELSAELAIKRDHVVDWAENAAGLIGRAAYAGRLQTRCRDRRGGPLLDVPPGMWGVNDFWPRFAASAFSFEHPYDETVEPSHWLFVDHEQLGRFADDLRRHYGQEPIWEFSDNAGPAGAQEPTDERAPPPHKKSRGGRRRGVGGFLLKDAPIVEKMVGLVLAEKIAPWAAATKLLDQIEGHTTNDDARVRRVVNRYYKRYNDKGEPLPGTE